MNISAVRSLGFALAKTMAVIGGLLLIILIVMTCVSITGRALNTIGNSDWLEMAFPTIGIFLQQFAPITGDFELVEMGIAWAIFQKRLALAHAKPH